MNRGSLLSVVIVLTSFLATHGEPCEIDDQGPDD